MLERALTNPFLDNSNLFSHNLLEEMNSICLVMLFQNYLLYGSFLVFWDLVVCVYGQQMFALHDFNVLLNTPTPLQPFPLSEVNSFAFLAHHNFLVTHV